MADPPRLDSPLGALAATVEAQYRVHPRFDVAARVDGIDSAATVQPAGGTALKPTPTAARAT